jgi:hypothetical protein
MTLLACFLSFLFGFVVGVAWCVLWAYQAMDPHR